MPNKTKINAVTIKNKELGSSSYKNSKQKKKLQSKKLAEVKKIVVKDRQIKVKIKHLQKELDRIDKISGKEFAKEKLVIEKKIAKLNLVNQKFVKVLSKG